MNWQDVIAPEKEACSVGRTWLLTQPDPLTAYRQCQNGSFMLWALLRLNVTLPIEIGFRAATRALVPASDALDKVGIEHTLRGRVINSPESANEAEAAANEVRWAAEAAEAARAAAAWAAAAWAAEAAEWAAAAWAAEAAEWAVYAMDTATNAELRSQANDVRELIPETIIIEALARILQ